MLRVCSGLAQISITAGGLAAAAHGHRAQGHDGGGLGRGGAAVGSHAEGHVEAVYPSDLSLF